MKEEKFSGKMKKLEQTIEVLFLLFLFLLIPQISRAGSLEKITEGLQNYLNNTRDFAASFVQETHLISFDEKQIASGEVFIAKPGKMKWEYQKPELQTIVINNQEVWLYTPEDNQVITTKVKNLGTTAFYDLFLSKDIKINKQFTVSQLEEEKSGSEQILLELRPRDVEININKVLLKLSRADYRIISFETYDKLDNITKIEFINIRRNKGIKPSTFIFKIPKGAEVITSEELGAP